MKMYLSNFPCSSVIRLIIDFKDSLCEFKTNTLSNINLKKYLLDNEYKLVMKSKQVALYIINLNIGVFESNIKKLITNLTIGSICLEYCTISIFKYDSIIPLHLKYCNIHAVNFYACVGDVLLSSTHIEYVNSRYGLKSLALDCTSTIFSAIIPYIDYLCIIKGDDFNITMLYGFLSLYQEQTSIEKYSMEIGILNICGAYRPISMIDYTVMAYVSPMVI